jgi:heat shock protein HtpX
MFIVSPLFGGGMTKLFSTHPDIHERMARLRAMAGAR